VNAFSQFLRFLGEQPGQEATVAEIFHENTKIAPQRSRPGPEDLSRHAENIERADITRYLAARPKDYPTADRFELPEADIGRERDLAAIFLARRSCREFDSTAGLQLSDIAAVLRFGFGCRPDGSERSRFVPSAGGLHGLEAYLLARRVNGLGTGHLYHYAPRAHALELLSTKALCAGPPIEVQSELTAAAALLLVTACSQRLTWKYGDRSYRLLLLEAGHAVQASILVAVSRGLACCPIGGFHDDAAHDLLAVDGVVEFVVYCLALGHERSPGSD